MGLSSPSNIFANVVNTTWDDHVKDVKVGPALHGYRTILDARLWGCVRAPAEIRELVTELSTVATVEHISSTVYVATPC